MTAHDFPALCPLGHRVVPSTDEHWTIRELEPGLYEYVRGHCDALQAQGPETAQRHHDTGACVGFTKLDEDFFDSSLVAEGPIPTAVFVLLLAKTKPDGIARVAASVVGGRLGLTAEQTAQAFAVLEGPDPHSRSLDHEGRRIQRVEGGWLILNYKKRRQEGLSEAWREYERERKRLNPPEASGRSPASSASASPSVSVSVEGGVGGVTPRLPANPLIAGRRPTLERDAYRLIREVNALEPELDPTEILMEAAGWKDRDGRTRSKVRVETMTDDHLIRTVHDLKSILEDAQRKHGAVR